MPSPHEKTWALVQLALGLGQMTGAVMGVTLLIQTGLNEVTLAVVCVTGSLTLLSRTLFPRSRS